MATPAVQNPSTESNSSRKKKAKAGSSTNGSTNVPAVPEVNGKEDSSLDAKENGESEHPYIKELTKHIRNTHKKLTGMQKVDAIIAEHPNTSLEDLVAQRKINPDQKAAALKKPQLLQQLAAYEEQVTQYRKIDVDYQVRLQKQKEELMASHQKEIEKLKEELGEKGKTSGVTELRTKLLVLSQFLRLAASKRNEVGAPETDEGRAFEGALLGVYGGGEEAVETALKLIDGSNEKVPSVEGDLTPVSYSQIRLASVAHAPYESEASWVDSVAEANAESTDEHPTSTDPTIAHAGLTEMEAPVNGMPPAAAQEALTSPPQADAGDETGNAAGDRWDTTAAGTQSKGDDEGFEMVPRPSDEVDVPNPAALPADALLTERSGNSWADEPPAYDTAAASGLMRDAGDVKATVAAGEAQVDTSWAAASEPTQPLSAGGWAEGSDAAGGAAAGQEDGDGFHQVPGRHRGRGGRGRGDGEGRGRGRGRGGFRGDGEFRGRGRGGFRGGRGEGGEFRGRGGGRGRGGPRGGAEGAARAS